MLESRTLTKNDQIALTLSKDFPDIYKKILNKLGLLINEDDLIQAYIEVYPDLQANRYIQGIKKYRNYKNCGLKEAKEFCDNMLNIRELDKGTISRTIKSEILLKLEIYKDKFPEFFL